MLCELWSIFTSPAAPAIFLLIWSGSSCRLTMRSRASSGLKPSSSTVWASMKPATTPCCTETAPPRTWRESGTINASDAVNETSHWKLHAQFILHHSPLCIEAWCYGWILLHQNMKSSFLKCILKCANEAKYAQGPISCKIQKSSIVFAF